MYNSQLNWFAVRVSYSRELALKEVLDEKHIENFLPMRHDYITKNGKRTRKLVPAIHNLVFIHSTRQCINELKEELGIKIRIRLLMNRELRSPIIIPDVQMRNFILVAGTYEEAVLYIDPVELYLVKGQKVRITDGIFKGVIGEFVRIRHDRRVVVSIEGVMAVATTYIHPSLVEPIKES